MSMAMSSAAPAAVRGRPAPAANWTDRLIDGDCLGGIPCSAWLSASYRHYRNQVLDPKYPCFFGTQAENRGEIFYTAIPAARPGALAASMATFVRLGHSPAFRRHNLAAFYEPVNLPRDQEGMQEWFWRELSILHAADRQHDRNGPFLQPDEPDWEFCFHGCQMFVVAGSPTYRNRRSRNLGPGLMLLFQPRAVFVDTVTNEQIAASVRDRIRKRLTAWDEVAPHPDLGFYGEPGNREWKQYCLPDDNAPTTGRCPFLTRMGIRH